MPLRAFSREQPWLLPPMLDEILPADHPVRFVAVFVDSLDAAAWEELGIDLQGDPRGAGAYHPRALLGAWVYGFMTGVRSCRKLEVACREQLPFMWLVGMQQPDHNTLWRFYAAHRDRMRALLRRTVRTAVKAGLVDLAVQAVDGTRIAANASSRHTRDAAGLRRLLERTEQALADLEAQNATGGDAAASSLPDELADDAALRQRVKEALARVEAEEGPRHTNLTDTDAGLLKSGAGGFITGYNAQAMVSPLGSEDEGAQGMLITAADATASGDDHPHLTPLIEAAADNIDAEREVVTVADAGYHSGANLAACDAAGHTVLLAETHQRRRRKPYHKDHFTYCPETDTYRCPHQKVLTYRGRSTHSNGYRYKRYRANGQDCRACPAFDVCTSSPHGRTLKISEYEPILQRHRRLMATAAAKQVYRRRKALVEPVFGLLKECHGARRFLLRGRRQVTSEWYLLATAFNLKSLHALWRNAFNPTPPPARARHIHHFLHKTRSPFTQPHIRLRFSLNSLNLVPKL